MNSSPQRTTAVIDLLSPSNRFISSSRLHSRLGRCRFIGRRYWWVVALIQLVVLVPLYFFTAELPLTYRSKARLWLTGRLNLNEGRLYTEELLDYQATQAELLRSFTVRERALAKLRTRFTNDFAASPQSGNKRFWAPVHQIKAYVRALAGPGTAATNNAESDFPFSLKVTESSKSSTLELQALGAKPASTRAFLNCLIDEYFAFKRETREKGSDRTLASVRSEARKVEEELRAQQGRLQSFQSSNNVVFLQEQGNSAGSYLAQLNRQIASLRTRLRLLERLEPDFARDLFVLKPMHSGFFGTALDILLGHLGVRTVVLTGVQGNMCVFATASDAYMRRYRVVVPSDCTASESDAENEHALHQMARAFKADTRPSSEIDLERHESCWESSV